MFPAATPCHGGPVCPKRSVPWGYGHFFLHFQVLLPLDLVKFSHGLSRYQWQAVGGKELLSPGSSKAHYGLARGLPWMPERSLPARARHVLMGSLTFLTLWSRSDTFLPRDASAERGHATI